MKAMKKSTRMSKIAKGKFQKCARLPWHQGQDLQWLDKGRFDQEREWQDCIQEAIGSSQEEVRFHDQEVDGCCEGCQEVFGTQGLRRSEEGHSSLYQGQVQLSVIKVGSRQTG